MVILSDVDAFPMNKTLLDPIYKNPNKKIWIYSYEDTLKHGITFNMKFTAMQASTWKNILYEANSFENLLSIFSEKLNIKTNTLSYRILYDQFIMSRAILDSKLCYLPANNLLWPQLNTDPILKTEENSNDDDKDTVGMARRHIALEKENVRKSFRRSILSTLQSKLSFHTQASNEDSGQREQSISNNSYDGYFNNNNALLYIGGGIITIAALKIALSKLNK